MRENDGSLLAGLEAKETDLGCRTLHLVFGVRSFSDDNALEIGHALLAKMKGCDLVGQTRGDVIIGP